MTGTPPPIDSGEPAKCTAMPRGITSGKRRCFATFSTDIDAEELIRMSADSPVGAPGASSTDPFAQVRTRGYIGLLAMAAVLGC